MLTDLPLSTGPCASRAHLRGVAQLLSGNPEEAAASFRQAVTEDPCFAVGHAGLAVALSELDGEARHEAAEALAHARQCSRHVSRFERHHVEVVLLALRQRIPRASALGQEHLSEFPGDAVARFVLVRWCEPPPERPAVQ